MADVKGLFSLPRGGWGFSPQGNGGFFSDRRSLLFPRRGKVVLALTGGGMAARMLAGSMQHRRGGTIPGPCRGRQSCRILESGLLHPPQAALFPPFSLFGCAKKHEAPTKSADFVGRGGAKERSGVLAEGGDGVEWISPRRRAVHGPKEKKRLKLNIRGIPIRGRAGSHRAVLPIYLPATGVLYCFAAGDEGVVLLSHAFLGSLWKPRLLLFPRLSSFVLRLSSLPPQGGGNAQGGTAVPS